MDYANNKYEKYTNFESKMEPIRIFNSSDINQELQPGTWNHFKTSTQVKKQKSFWKMEPIQ